MDAGSIAMMTAVLDLKMVQSIRAGIKANLIAAGGVPGPLGTVTMPGPAPKGQSQQTRIEPPLKFRPDPRFEARPVHTPTPKFVARPEIPVAGQPPVREVTGPEPIWKKLPEIEKPAPVLEPKCKFEVADVIHRGQLIDLFV